ncbi:MAG: NADP-dependent phosphogluconate dehydrogenase [Actinobacteria bacterium]|nr:NADP-dependent phosphogluconate dehydrogenase [Actinomycetota bacterium]
MNETIGLIGIGVMGSNIALNFSDKNIPVHVFNKSKEKINSLMKKDLNGNITGSTDIEKFINSLPKPRKILMLIPSGKPTFDMAKKIIGYLEPNDILIDGGNAYYLDSNKLGKICAEKEIEFVGMGVSGGEEGARKGPALMIGSSKPINEELKNSLSLIAANYNNKPSIGFYKGHGTGHFIKMLHNGIEYAEMQIIAEAFHMLKKANFDNEKISNFFRDFKKENRSSYLIEITSNIMLKKNKSGYLIDQIKSEASHKGTGKLTVETSLNYSFPLPSIYEAFNARVESNFQNWWSEKLEREEIHIDTGFLSNTIYFARLATMAQGLLFVEHVSSTENLEINLNEVLQNWSAGCIIRSDLLKELKDANLSNTITSSKFVQNALIENIDDVKKVIKSCVVSGVSIPVITSSYNWFVGTSSSFNPSSLIQAQRDYFGSHQVQVNNSDEFIHLDWD